MVFFFWGNHAHSDAPLIADMAQWWRPIQEVNGGQVEQSAATQSLDVM